MGDENAAVKRVHLLRRTEQPGADWVARGADAAKRLPVLAGVGQYWPVLAGAGRYCLVLTGTGWCWPVLAGVDRYCLGLTGIGWC